MNYSLNHPCTICKKCRGEHRSTDSACPSGNKSKIGYLAYSSTVFTPKQLTEKELEKQSKRFIL